MHTLKSSRIGSRRLVKTSLATPICVFTPLSTLLQLKMCIRRYFEKSESGLRKTIASAEHGFLALSEWCRSLAFADGAAPPMGLRLRRNEGQGQKGCFRFHILNQPRGYNFS